MAGNADTLTAHLQAMSSLVSYHSGGVGHQIVCPVAPRAFVASDLQRHTGDVLECARDRTVLVRDKDTTFALEPWTTWHFQHAVLGLLGGIADPSRRRRRRRVPVADDARIRSSPWSPSEVSDAPELLELAE